MAAKTQIEIGEARNAANVARPTELPAGIVRLWWLRLDSSQADVNACYEWLSSKERDRTERFKIERSRTAFVLTRGTLRSLLAQYLGKKPEELRFGYESWGKPFLEGESSLRFNVSHTDGLALIGVVKERNIGVDVEKVKTETEVARLAERFFSRRENDDLKGLQGDELRAAFFRCWTRKEAYIKARGEGLSLPLHQFDVSVARDERKALLATRPDALEADRWILRDVPVRTGYMAAVAVEENE